MGQMEMKCIFNIGKHISILAKVTRVSAVANEPLVYLITIYSQKVNGIGLQAKAYLSLLPTSTPCTKVLQIIQEYTCAFEK
jgi:hypothetical protein